MGINIDNDVLEQGGKSVYDLIVEAKNEATRRGIKANSIVINKGLVFVPGSPYLYPDMVCGLKSYITAKELPEEYAFAVCHDPNRKPEPMWIPVSERLPDHFGVFIVAIREPCKERVGKDCADYDPFAKTWLPSMCWDKGYEVTHWMPLPEPPKEVTE